jgi:transposase, IS6 family
VFRGRHFEDVIILLCVRWYLRYSLTYRDLEEMMAERGLSVDHLTIWRWVQRYAPIVGKPMEDGPDPTLTQEQFDRQIQSLRS